MAKRAVEVLDVKPEARDVYLATQIDDLETHTSGAIETLAAEVGALREELAHTRTEMARTGNRIVMAVLGAALTVIGGIVTGIVLSAT